MLRGLLAALLLANLMFFSWSRGWLDDVVGLSPQRDREPQRLAAQIAPEALQILPPATLTRRAPPPVCLEAGPFTPAELPQAESALRRALPEGGWALLTRERPGSWMAYMGRYNSKVTMQRRAEELRRREVAFEEVRNLPDYEPGFIFGRYNREADARESVRRLQEQKVRFARVVRLEPPSTSHVLRVPKADPATQERLTQIDDLPQGRKLQPCGRDSRP
ncbi:putative signal peptide protein [Leptothrix cholodnii SP-6]|uniref:Putative signal peptide protein n=1 Tax=Leptothrix cholodnii (strain ATCC 51168 / LMG 8142 / SP-6) TaxID=395495 RepID=B1Y7Q3_LEPCP|nr:hypothetical protein [Leptothrix cholodnii]ACB32501.1 putative signal peptide protein [Leptothrix cholodnii SP-6]